MSTIYRQYTVNLYYLTESMIWSVVSTRLYISLGSLLRPLISLSKSLLIWNLKASTKGFEIRLLSDPGSSTVLVAHKPFTVKTLTLILNFFLSLLILVIRVMIFV